jgi:hypothetical protein
LVIGPLTTAAVTLLEAKASGGDATASLAARPGHGEHQTFDVFRG